MPDLLLDHLQLPSGSTYELVDAWARERIGSLGSGVEWLGITTTTGISDGVEWTTGSPKTIKTVTINGTAVTPRNGDIIQTNYSGEGSKEYILSITASGETVTSAKWQEFGDLSALKSFAFADTGSGTVDVPTSASFTGTNKSHTFSGTLSDYVNGATFTGDYYSLSGSVTVPKTYTSTPTSTSTNATITEVSSGNNMQAKGTVSTPTISLKTAGATGTVHNPSANNVVTNVEASAPAEQDGTGEMKYYSVSGTTLILKKILVTKGDSITTSDLTVKTGDGAYQSSQPTFTGQKYLVKYDKTTSISTSTNATESKTVTITSGAGTSESNTFQASGTVDLTTTSKSVSVSGNVKATGTVALTNSSKTVTVYPVAGT